MGMALELLLFIGIFGLAIGLIGCCIESTDNGKRRVRAEHEAQRYARNPWDAERTNVPTHRYR